MAPKDEIEIALLGAEIKRINTRLHELETRSEATVAILNKWGGGIAVSIIIVSAIWALVLAYGANIRKAVSGA